MCTKGSNTSYDVIEIQFRLNDFLGLSSENNTIITELRKVGYM